MIYYFLLVSIASEVLVVQLETMFVFQCFFAQASVEKQPLKKGRASLDKRADP